MHKPHSALPRGPVPYAVQVGFEFEEKRGRRFVMYFALLTCSQCRKVYPELAHSEGYSESGVLLLEMDDGELYENFPPEIIIGLPDYLISS
jgi:hypothetical protein